MGGQMEKLEMKRKELFRRLTQLGEFRRGNVAAGARKCGKKNCACAQPGHAGHPRYLRSTTRGSRSEARTLRVGPELEKFTQEVDNYRVFLELTRELVEVNEKICELLGGSHRTIVLYKQDAHPSQPQWLTLARTLC